MDHIAIMKKSWKLIPKILSGEKTIESRWYKNRVAPWNRIKSGDTVYFRDSGEKVTVKAEVNKVLQYEKLDRKQFTEIMTKYAQEIGLTKISYNEYYQSKNYCILIFLDNIEKLPKPFLINKTGYGISSAWMCVGDINSVNVHHEIPVNKRN